MKEPFSVTQEDYDQLYHILRKIAIGKNKSEAVAAMSLSAYLLKQHNYLDLFEYSSFYGGRFLLAPITTQVAGTGWPIKRFVELGAGSGWLSGGLSGALGLDPPLLIDKRPWPGTVIVDLESSLPALPSHIKEGDIIVMADLLHCVTNGAEIIKTLNEWPIIILEFNTEADLYGASFHIQVAKFGGENLTTSDIEAQFGDREYKTIDISPYKLFLLDAK